MEDLHGLSEINLFVPGVAYIHGGSIDIMYVVNLYVVGSRSNLSYWVILYPPP